MMKILFLSSLALLCEAWTPTGSFYFRQYAPQNNHGFTPTIAVMTPNYQVRANLITRLDVVYDPLETAQLGAPPTVQVTLTPSQASTNCGLSRTHSPPYTATSYTLPGYTARQFSNPPWNPFSKGPGYWDPNTLQNEPVPNWILLWCVAEEPGVTWTITASVTNNPPVVDGTNNNAVVPGAVYGPYSQTFVVGPVPTLTITKVTPTGSSIPTNTEAMFALNFSPASETIDLQLTMQVIDPTGQAGCTIGRYWQPQTFIQQPPLYTQPQIIYHGNPATAYGYTQPASGIWPTTAPPLYLQAGQTVNYIFVKCNSPTSCPLRLTSTGQPHGNGPRFVDVVDSAPFTVGTGGPLCPPPVPIVAARPDLSVAGGPDPIGDPTPVKGDTMTDTKTVESQPMGEAAPLSSKTEIPLSEVNSGSAVGPTAFIVQFGVLSAIVGHVLNL